MSNFNKKLIDNTSAFKLKYDAVSNKSRRRAPTQYKKAETGILPETDRLKLSATVYDLIRNEPTARWAYNKFLDYTTKFYFQSKTRNSDFDKSLELAFYDWSKKKNCDIAGRNSFDDMIRLFGSGICLDGDAGLSKLKDYKLQGIESDRIASPDKLDIKIKKGFNVQDGLIYDAYGKVQAYIICSRKSDKQKANTYQQILAYDDMVYDGHFFRFDQLRGIPMFAPAVNIWQDIKEIDEYQLIKCKKHAMFGIMLKSSESGKSGFNETPQQVSTDENGDAVNQYLADMEAGLKIEGGEKDGVDMFESKTPSSEYREYSELMLRKAFSAFFVPYTFFDSRQSSYVAGKMDKANFTTSTKSIKAKIQNALEDITEWILPYLIENYNIKMPKGVKDISMINWEWIPEGDPWLNEVDEVNAAGLRVASGFSNRNIECKKRGLNFYEVAEGLADEESFIAAKNISITLPQPGLTTVNQTKNMENNQ